MDYKAEAELIVARFLTEVPHREGKYPLTEDAKINAIIAVNWHKSRFAGDYHKRDCEEIIKEIKLL